VVPSTPCTLVDEAFYNSTSSFVPYLVLLDILTLKRIPQVQNHGKSPFRALRGA